MSTVTPPHEVGQIDVVDDNPLVSLVRAGYNPFIFESCDRIGDVCAEMYTYSVWVAKTKFNSGQLCKYFAGGHQTFYRNLGFFPRFAKFMAMAGTLSAAF
jgi:hypothetical protein